MNEIQKLVPTGAENIALSPKGTIMLRTVGEAAGFASLMASSGMLPKGVSPQFAVVAIVAGASIGLNPFESVQSIAVINGRPSLYGDGMKAVVQGSGVWEGEKVDWFKGADGSIVACQVTVRRKGNQEPIVGRFSKKMAQQAGLWGKQGPWTMYPARMLLARARVFAYRDGFADILKGVRSAEEENDILATTSEAVLPSPAVPVAQLPKPRGRRRSSAAEIIEATPETADMSDFVVSPASETDATGAETADNSPSKEPVAVGGDFLQ